MSPTGLDRSPLHLRMGNLLSLRQLREFESKRPASYSPRLVGFPEVIEEGFMRDDPHPDDLHGAPHELAARHIRPAANGQRPVGRA